MTKGLASTFEMLKYIYMYTWAKRNVLYIIDDIYIFTCVELGYKEKKKNVAKRHTPNGPAQNHTYVCWTSRIDNMNRSRRCSKG